MKMKGLRLVVAAFGILCGLTGIIAGIYEILQGNVPTNGFEISTIGNDYLMADDFTYHAITIIPNFLATGILAVIFSTLVIIWSLRFAERRYRTSILFGLSISQMLVGGAWVIDIALITCLLATRIHSPLDWWQRYFSENSRNRLEQMFPISVVVFSIISGIMLALTFFGVNSQIMIDALSPLATLMFLPILLMIIGGISVDIRLRQIQ